MYWRKPFDLPRFHFHWKIFSFTCRGAQAPTGNNAKAPLRMSEVLQKSRDNYKPNFILLSFFLFQFTLQSEKHKKQYK